MTERAYELDARVSSAVFRAIDDLNQMLPQEHWLAKSRETPILGPTAVLDSMGFVNLIAAVEESVAAELGLTVSLLGREERRGAFKTVGTLVTYISEVLTAKAAAIHID